MVDSCAVWNFVVLTLACNSKKSRVRFGIPDRQFDHADVTGLAKRRSDGLTALRLAVTCRRLRSNRCGAISLTTGILPV
jgi:hypothetical protein